MLHNFLLRFLSTNWSLNTEFPSVHSSSSLTSTTNTIRPRQATLADAADITDVYLSAFESNSLHQYLYQFRHEHEEYHFECTRRVIQHNIEASLEWDNVTINVIDQPVNPRLNFIQRALGGKATTARVVSAAMWVLLIRADSSTTFSSWPLSSTLSSTLSALSTTSHSEEKAAKNDLNCSARLDQNITRVEYVDAQVAGFKKRYVYDAYDRQLQLGLLATHPDWDGNGFAAAQLAWGMRWAKREKVNATLGSTPAGYGLYKAAGFLDVANITVQRVPRDEGPPFWGEMMRWEP